MSRSILPFDPLTVPVQGTALIEASAGTGKTYGIAALFARLFSISLRIKCWWLPSPKPPPPN